MRLAGRIKFASDKGNQTTTDNVEDQKQLFEQSENWVLQFDLADNQYGQRTNGSVPAHIATTGWNRVLGQAESVMRLELTSS